MKFFFQKAIYFPRTGGFEFMSNTQLRRQKLYGKAYGSDL